MRIHRVAALCAATLLAAGCGTPGRRVQRQRRRRPRRATRRPKVDVSKAGNVTLTVWDQEVRGGQAKQIKRLNEAFQEKYPNVTIKRVAKSFTDLNTTLKLAVSGTKAPDVVEANQGRPIMGQLVKGGLLRPIDAYADAYGWEDRCSKTLLDLNRFSSDGKQFGAGTSTASRRWARSSASTTTRTRSPRCPRRSASSSSMLAKAKQDGDVPISFGNLDKFGGIHEYQTVQNQFADKQAMRDFVFARDGASFDTPENEEAAKKLQDWATKGYFTPDYNGTGYDPAWQQFAKGEGPFLIAGTWLTSDLADAMGDKVGFFLMPGPEAGRRTGLARRREPAVGHHPEVQEPRRGGRLHRLPHQPGGRRRCWWRPTTCRR